MLIWIVQCCQCPAMPPLPIPSSCQRRTRIRLGYFFDVHAQQTIFPVLSLHTHATSPICSPVWVTVFSPFFLFWYFTGSGSVWQSSMQLAGAPLIAGRRSLVLWVSGRARGPADSEVTHTGKRASWWWKLQWRRSGPVGAWPSGTVRAGGGWAGSKLLLGWKNMWVKGLWKLLFLSSKRVAGASVAIGRTRTCAGRPQLISSQSP